MNYLLQSKRKSRNPIKKILIILLVCIVVKLTFSDFISNSFVFVGNSLKSTLEFLIPSGLRSNNEILSQNESLRNELANLQAEVVDRQVLKLENENIKTMLGRDAKSINNNSILATIIKGPRETPNDTFVLDVGRDLGVSIGDNVMFGNLAIGTIVDVGDDYSNVRLYSSPQSLFNGVLVKDNIKIEAKGIGGGQFQASVPIGSTASVGDTFILPSISPKVFGVVKEVIELPAEGFKTLLFTLPVNISQISHVLITN